ncbi:MAG: Crp/Fnr family transcriptional regulator, partial [Devosia sp.]
MVSISDVKNLLLRAMDPWSFSLLAPSLEAVTLPAKRVLGAAGAKIEWVYFPDDGMLSIVSHQRLRRDVEMGVIGREGMSGVSLLLGDAVASSETNVQIAGHGWRIDAKSLMSAARVSPALQDLLLLYARALEIQTSSTIVANARGNLEQRLARWLLMSHDRADGDRLEITHAFLATMLAARRPGVTVALHVLEGRHLIRSLRGQVIIL